jgi:hypothetical protein
LRRCADGGRVRILFRRRFCRRLRSLFGGRRFLLHNIRIFLGACWPNVRRQKRDENGD